MFNALNVVPAMVIFQQLLKLMFKAVNVVSGVVIFQQLLTLMFNAANVVSGMVYLSATVKTDVQCSRRSS